MWKMISEYCRSLQKTRNIFVLEIPFGPDGQVLRAAHIEASEWKSKWRGDGKRWCVWFGPMLRGRQGDLYFQYSDSVHELKTIVEDLIAEFNELPEHQQRWKLPSPGTEWKYPLSTRTA